MADIIIELIFGLNVFTWINSNLINSNNTRREYIDSIKKADGGIIEPLLNFARNKSNKNNLKSSFICI
jgi:hypothetical protein